MYQHLHLLHVLILFQQHNVTSIILLWFYFWHEHIVLDNKLFINYSAIILLHKNFLLLFHPLNVWFYTSKDQFLTQNQLQIFLSTNFQSFSPFRKYFFIFYNFDSFTNFKFRWFRTFTILINLPSYSLKFL